MRSEIDAASAVIRRRSSLAPEIGIILGTGLGGLAAEIRTDAVIPYSEIPHFPLSTVESHQGKLILGTLSGRPVVAMQGRFHFYEGYTMRQVVFPVRVMSAGLGIRTLLISNAAGGLNPEFRKGDLMLIVDHINLQGENPLAGPNDASMGPRFPDMSCPYDRGLQELARKAAAASGTRLREGVFAAVQGPNLETRAEYRFLRIVGADAVGMSTVPEVLVAVHMGMKVMAMSIITDECFPDTLEPVTIEEVVKVASAAEPKLTAVFSRVAEAA